MKNRFYLFLIATALFAPSLHAMEDDSFKVVTIELEIHPSFIYGGPITPDVFTEKSKKFMQQGIDALMVGCGQDNVTTGLAGIYNFIKKAGIEALIQDDKNLQCANIFLGKFIANPAVTLSCELEAIEGAGCDFAKEWRKGAYRATRIKAWVNVLREFCPEYEPISEMSIRKCISEKVELADRIQELRRNEGLAVEANIPYVVAEYLVGGYCVSLEEQLAGAGQS